MRCGKLMMTLQRLPVPVIARVQGIATAAGCQLVAQCDLAVASTTARFAVSGVNLGLFCATPSVALTRNLGRKAAFEMLATGEFISAEQALAKGLVNRVGAPEQLDAEVERLVASIVAKPRLALAMGKELFYQQLECGIDAAYQQYFNQYTTANIPLHSGRSRSMYDVLIGGISLYYYDQGVLTEDPGLPWVDNVTSLVRTRNGAFQEY